MSRATYIIILAILGLLCFGNSARAFGAGNIPSFAFLEGKAFRHGDIEDVLVDLAKKSGRGGFLGLGGAAKFTGLDVKRVYFGNWLRDYSQAIDVAALKKTNVQTIINLLMALGFMAMGYATEEFEITKERLGVYLPVEHIDNPKGYAEGEDARQYDPRLRPPVNPEELQIDPRTGMKNYIANENGNWDTSKALVRRTIEQCIHHGRMSRARGNDDDEYEAYRLLGQAMHTLEDFTAHSNFCELALISLGYHDVFPHVGQNAIIKAPNGQMVPPLVTGTFGGSDFIHSLLGEAGDHLSEASISDLNRSINKARSDPANSDSGLRNLLLQMPGGEGQALSRDVDSIRNGSSGDPNNMSPQQLHATLWKILAFRDKVSKGISVTIEKIPGLNSLVEKITNSLNVFVFTTIEPFLGPILKSSTSGLSSLSQQVINDPDQFAVFDNPNSDDPTHSFLSKDHFGLILNEPAGNLARINITHAVKLIVEAWDDTNIDARGVGEKAWESVFHPMFYDSRSQIQSEMMAYMKQWIDTQPKKQEILNRLTKASVRSNNNRRIGDTSGSNNSHDHGGVPSQGLQGVLATHNVHVPGATYLNQGTAFMSSVTGFQSTNPVVFRDGPFDQNIHTSGPPHPSYQNDSGYPGAQQYHQQSYQQQPSFGGGDQYGAPPSFASHQNSFQYQQPPYSGGGGESQFGGPPPLHGGYAGHGQPHHDPHQQHQSYQQQIYQGGPPPHQNYDSGYGQNSNGGAW
ncbi:Heterokaryon incompatibility Het-C [Phaffia rhodozyma]|uniref:Heterokaryon incompatibility Het-C n=1 Tax=Phaffia rhodozyma TaxID=264483 RepID=A0A0F7SJQ8_PHARH|nr:Heterokaryon incompatibility Het-C [Phaffia rhodozyma]